MIIKNLEIRGVNYGDAEVKVGRYVEGGVAIQLVDADDGQPVITATVNLPNHPPLDGHFWLKTWGENEGLLVALGAAGVIEFDEQIRTVDVNDYGSQAIEAKPKGMLKFLVDQEVATW